VITHLKADIILMLGRVKSFVIRLLSLKICYKVILQSHIRQAQPCLSVILAGHTKHLIFVTAFEIFHIC